MLLIKPSKEKKKRANLDKTRFFGILEAFTRLSTSTDNEWNKTLLYHDYFYRSIIIGAMLGFGSIYIVCQTFAFLLLHLSDRSSFFPPPISFNWPFFTKYMLAKKIICGRFFLCWIILKRKTYIRNVDEPNVACFWHMLQSKVISMRSSNNSIPL